jgi:hypothetical protein
MASFKKRRTQQPPQVHANRPVPGESLGKHTRDEPAADPRTSVLGNPWASDRMAPFWLCPSGQSEGESQPRITSSAMAASPESQNLIVIAPTLYALQFADRAPDKGEALATIREYIDQTRDDPESLDLPLGGDPASGELPMAYVLTGLVAQADQSVASLMEFEPDVSDDDDLFQWHLETGFPFCLALVNGAGGGAEQPVVLVRMDDDEVLRASTQFGGRHRQ